MQEAETLKSKFSEMERLAQQRQAAAARLQADLQSQVRLPSLRSITAARHKHTAAHYFAGLAH